MYVLYSTFPIHLSINILNGSTIVLIPPSQVDVQCPVCQAYFHPEIIQGHAARCGEDNGVYV